MTYTALGLCLIFSGICKIPGFLLEDTVAGLVFAFQTMGFLFGSFGFVAALNPAILLSAQKHPMTAFSVVIAAFACLILGLFPLPDRQSPGWTTLLLNQNTSYPTFLNQTSSKSFYV